MKRRWPRPHAVSLWQVASAVTGLAAGLLVAAGSFSVTPQTIASSAGTYWDRNPHVVQALAQQAAEGRAGVFLVIVSVVFGLLALVAEAKGAKEGASKPVAWLLALVLSVGLGWVTNHWAAQKARELVEAVNAIR
jgi:hypothetical protein